MKITILTLALVVFARMASAEGPSFDGAKGAGLSELPLDAAAAPATPASVPGAKTPRRSAVAQQV